MAAQQKGLTERERTILREVLCLLKKLTPDECDEGEFSLLCAYGNGIRIFYRN